MLRVTIQLSPPLAGDTLTREFHTIINGTEQPVQNLVKDAGSFPANAIFEFEPGTPPNNCEVWLVDIDKAGNRSPESDHHTFVAEDTFAPPKPGALGVLNIEQI